MGLNKLCESVYGRFFLKWYNVYGAIGKAPTYTPKRLISNLG